MKKQQKRLLDKEEGLGGFCHFILVSLSLSVGIIPMIVGFVYRAVVEGFVAGVWVYDCVSERVKRENEAAGGGV